MMMIFKNFLIYSFFFLINSNYAFYIDNSNYNDALINSADNFNEEYEEEVYTEAGNNNQFLLSMEKKDPNTILSILILNETLNNINNSVAIVETNPKLKKSKEVKFDTSTSIIEDNKRLKRRKWKIYEDEETSHVSNNIFYVIIVATAVLSVIFVATCVYLLVK